LANYQFGEFKTAIRKGKRLFVSYDQGGNFFGLNTNWPLIISMGVILFLIVPAVSSDYVLGSILVPVAIMSIAVMGLNLVMGYAGQPSLGTGGLMAVGAFTTYKVVSTVPELPMLFAFILGGIAAGFVGVIFGLTSLRLKAFYLAIATLAAQFFLEWVFSKVGWFWNYQAQGIVTPPPVTIFGTLLDTKIKVYLFVVTVALAMAALAHNLLRSHVGREWIAIRDNDIAAEIIGVDIPMAKLTVFAISSFYCGIAGGLLAFIHIQSVTISTFTIEMSLKVMFMVIVGGMGSLIGCFLGAAFIFLLPILLNVLPTVVGLELSTEVRSYLELILFGTLIIVVLIVDQAGLARLVHWLRDRIRSWPYPYSA